MSRYSDAEAKSGMEREAKSYEERLTKALDRKITLRQKPMPETSTMTIEELAALADELDDGDTLELTKGQVESLLEDIDEHSADF